MKKLLFAGAFTIAIGAAFATSIRDNSKKPPITAFETPGCSTSRLVNCSTSVTQSCTVDGKSYKQKDANGNCNITLGLN